MGRRPASGMLAACIHSVDFCTEAHHEVFVLIIVPLDCTSFSHSIPAYSKLLSISNWLSNRLVRLEVLCN
jgi:hypothetical protein